MMRRSPSPQNRQHETASSLATYRHPDVPIRLTLRGFTAGESFWVGSPQAEQLMTLFSGELQVTGPVSVLLARRTVLEDPPAAIYVGRGQKVTATGKKAGELMIVECEARQPGSVRQVRPAPPEERGRDGFRHTVSHLIDEKFPAERLLVGETHSCPGNWSSFPPQKHEQGARGKTQMQQVCFFKVQPKTGFGLSYRYDDAGLDESSAVHNNDVVWIPGGYHTISAPPGHRLYYLWALAGDGRTPRSTTDPQFRRLL